MKSKIESETDFAMKKVKFLRKKYGKDLPSLKNVTRDRLFKSQSLRSTILAGDFQFFLENENPQGSF